jgi:hypothetical protein
MVWRARSGPLGRAHMVAGYLPVLRPFEVVKRGPQYGARSPFKRRTWVHIPGGSTHWFRFRPGGGEMISITSRAGAAAFFTDVDLEVSAAEPDFGTLLRVASSHGLTVPLPATNRRVQLSRTGTCTRPPCHARSLESPISGPGSKRGAARDHGRRPARVSARGARG